MHSLLLDYFYILIFVERTTSDKKNQLRRMDVDIGLKTVLMKHVKFSGKFRVDRIISSEFQVLSLTPNEILYLHISYLNMKDIFHYTILFTLHRRSR